MIQTCRSVDYDILTILWNKITSYMVSFLFLKEQTLLSLFIQNIIFEKRGDEHMKNVTPL